MNTISTAASFYIFQVFGRVLARRNQFKFQVLVMILMYVVCLVLELVIAALIRLNGCLKIDTNRGIWGTRRIKEGASDFPKLYRLHKWNSTLIK